MHVGFLPGGVGTDGGFCKLLHSSFLMGSEMNLGHHALPEEANNKPKVVRRRLRGKSSHVGGVDRETSPPPKRRKSLSLPGHLGGYQESSYFPRVGVG